MSENHRLTRVNHYIDRVTEEIDQELRAERIDTAELAILERELATKRVELVKKRENISRLERKAALLYAIRAVEELPEGTLAQRYSKFYELIGLHGITPEGVHPVQLTMVLSVTVERAHRVAFGLL